MGLDQVQMAERLGISPTYVSSLENGRKQPSEGIVKHVELLERAFDSGLFVPPSVARRAMEKSAAALRSESASTKPPTRMIPVVSWAHAGQASNYEELPKDWQHLVPTECRDEDAFALRLEGDSMTRDYHPGDLLIISPNTEVYSGCLAVVRFVNDSVVFREIELRSDVVRLMPLNERWSPEIIAKDQISWIYRVYGMWRQLVK